MSQMGQSRRFWPIHPTSALPPITPPKRTSRHFRSVPGRAALAPDIPSVFAVFRLMTSFELGRLLHRRIGCLGAFQYLVDECCRSPEQHVDVYPVPLPPYVPLTFPR